MTVETEVAKLGIKASWQGVKVVLFAVVVFAVVGAIGWMLWGAKQREVRLRALEAYKTSTEARGRVTNAADVAADAAYDGAREQDAGQVRVVIEQSHATEEARREDPTVDAFLSQRIPQRLRDADARARRARGLDEDREGRR